MKDFVIMNAVLPLELLKKNSYEFWFLMIQLIDIDDTISQYVSQYPELVVVMDRDGRLAEDVACPKNREVMKAILLIHGR